MINYNIFLLKRARVCIMCPWAFVCNTTGGGLKDRYVDVTNAAVTSVRRTTP